MNNSLLGAAMIPPEARLPSELAKIRGPSCPSPQAPGPQVSEKLYSTSSARGRAGTQERAARRGTIGFGGAALTPKNMSSGTGPQPNRPAAAADRDAGSAAARRRLGGGSAAARRRLAARAKFRYPFCDPAIEFHVVSNATARRAPQNPIVIPAMVRPSQPGLEVVGAFNPAVVRHDGEVLLLLRVAEAPRTAAGEVAAPIYDVDSGLLEIRKWARDSDGVDTSDPRATIVDGHTWLTSISHLRIARSQDGIHFEVEPTPAMSPSNAYESFGLEDPRITLLDGTYWINYTAVSPYGISTALASTKDFRTFDRHGIIFPPPNRDVTIFPEKIGGRYAALHRPMAGEPGEHAIWAASSLDLMDWGSHRYVAGARPASWDDSKIGGGAVPFRVRTHKHDGWLAVYHGVTASPMTYSLGALLLDANDPSQVIARSREPILRPEAEYERSGFFDGVVFTCGLLAQEDLVRIYYGAADGVTAVADLSLKEILSDLSEL